MATLQDIRSKIGAVKKTQQITKAMNMVAAAKLRGAQMRMENFRPYAGKFLEVINNLSSRIDPEVLPLDDPAAGKKGGIDLPDRGPGTLRKLQRQSDQSGGKVLESQIREQVEVSLVTGRQKRMRLLSTSKIQCPQSYLDIFSSFDMVMPPVSAGRPSIIS